MEILSCKLIKKVNLKVATIEVLIKQNDTFQNNAI